MTYKFLGDDATWHNQISISPTPASKDKGIYVDQSGPVTGSDATLDIYLNQFSITADALAATNSFAGTVYGLAVTYAFGGSNMQGQRVGVSGSVSLTSPSSSSNAFGIYTGTVGLCQMASADGGTNTTSGAKGSGLGLYGTAIASDGATNLYEIVGGEFDVSYRSGTSGKYLVGVRISKWADSVADAAVTNAGIQFINQSGATGWKDYGIVFDAANDGYGTLFQSGATIIGTKGSISATDGIDFSSVTFSGSAFKSYHFGVTGNGDVFANSLTVTAAGSPPTNGLALPSANVVGIYANSLKVSAFAADSSAVNSLWVQAKVTGQSPQLAATGSDANVGLIFGTKGTGGVSFVTDLFSTYPTQFEVLHAALATHHITVAGSNGDNPVINTTGGDLAITPNIVGGGSIKAGTDLYSANATYLIRTLATLTNGSGASTATLTNAPAGGNPTKWISIDDNGTTRKIPAW